MASKQNTEATLMTGSRWLAAGLCCGMAVVIVAIIFLSMPSTLAVSFAWTAASIALFTLRGVIVPRLQPRWLASPLWFMMAGGAITTGLLVQGSLVFSEGQAKAGEGSLWMMSAGLAFIATLLQSDTRAVPGESDEQPAPMVIHRERPRWVPLLAGVALMLITTEINANFLALDALRQVSSHVQFAMWVAAVVLVGYGLAGSRTILEEDPPTSAAPKPYREWLALVGILALGFGLRVYQLRDAQRFLIDEIHFLNPIIYFWEDAYIGILQPFSSIAAFPYLFPYLQWLSAELVNHNLEGLRFTSAVFGVLTVWAVYLLARVLFGGRVGLISAALLAAMPVHVQFSRIGLNNIADPFFGTLAVYFIARGWRSPKHMVGNFAWAGVMTGLTQYWYEGGRLMFPVLLIGWLIIIGLIALFSGWRRGAYQQYRRALIVLLAGAIIVGAPVYLTLLNMDRPFSQRMETAGLSETELGKIDGFGGLLDHAVSSIYQSYLIHVSIPEEALYYGGDDPLLASYVVPLFITGLFYAFWLVISTGTFYQQTNRQILLQSGAILLLLWVAVTWGGNVLMARSRIAARYVVAFPALAMLAALGLDALVGLLVGWRRRWREAALVTLLTLGVTLQASYFFGEYMERFNEQFTEEQVGRSLNIDDAVQRAAALPAGTNVHVIDSVPLLVSDLNNTLRFYRGEHTAPTIRLQAIEPLGFNISYLATLNLDQSNAFFVSPDDLGVVAILYNSFEYVQGPYFTDHTPSKTTQLVLYYVPPQPLQQLEE